LSIKWSRRERLMMKARWLGLDFSPSISENTLRRLIDNQPATKRQVELITGLLERFKVPFPADLSTMTFGHAVNVINEVKESLNSSAIEMMGFDEGMVCEWGDEYYLIIKIYGESLRHRMLIQQVTLSRMGNTQKAILTPIGRQRSIDPSEMLYLSVPVDLTRWSPTNKSSYQDEPPF